MQRAQGTWLHYVFSPTIVQSKRMEMFRKETYSQSSPSLLCPVHWPVLDNDRIKRWIQGRPLPGTAHNLGEGQIDTV